MKKSIVFASLLFLVVAGKAQESKPTTPAQFRKIKMLAEMKFDVEEYNFGTIKQGEKVTYDFNFLNYWKRTSDYLQCSGKLWLYSSTMAKRTNCKGCKRNYPCGIQFCRKNGNAG